MTEFSERFAQLCGPLSQREAFIALGVTEQTVRRWEKGLRRPDFDNILRIYEVTEAPLEYIMCVTDDWDGRPAWWPTEESTEQPEGADAVPVLRRSAGRGARRAAAVREGRAGKRKRRPQGSQPDQSPDEDPPA